MYTLNGKVVANPKGRPECPGFEDEPYHWYVDAMIIWKSFNFKVENAHVSEHPIECHKEITLNKPVWQIVSIGQPCYIENGEVTKIL